MTATTENDNDLIGNFDANAWARRFVERMAVNPTMALDTGAMTTWFSAAIMAGYDKGRNDRD